jgi:hypothetical protein
MADVRLHIKVDESQLDHPTCWRGYGGTAFLVIILVVARKVGRLDDTGSR